VLSADDAALWLLQAFVVIAVYNITRLKVALMPLVVRIWVECAVAFRRVKVLSSLYVVRSAG